MERRAELSAGAAVICALLYGVGGLRLILALLPAVAVHELGHIAALRLLGLRVRGIRWEAQGLCIRYSGRATAAGELLAALSGPAAGALYAVAASCIAESAASDTLRLSAELSLLFSAFNLLPALPLDGGRALRLLLTAWLGEKRGASVTAAVRLLTGGALLLLGAWLLWQGRGAAVFAAGAGVILMKE